MSNLICCWLLLWLLIYNYVFLLTLILFIYYPIFITFHDFSSIRRSSFLQPLHYQLSSRLHFSFCILLFYSSLVIIYSSSYLVLLAIFFIGMIFTVLQLDHSNYSYFKYDINFHLFRLQSYYYSITLSIMTISSTSSLLISLLFSLPLTLHSFIIYSSFFLHVSSSPLILLISLLLHLSSYSYFYV